MAPEYQRHKTLRRSTQFMDSLVPRLSTEREQLLRVARLKDKQRSMYAREGEPGDKARPCTEAAYVCVRTNVFFRIAHARAEITVWFTRLASTLPACIA